MDKASGPDLLCPRILSETREQIVGALKWLFEKSLTNGELPQDWKKAVVVPIYKKGRRDCPENYRPVSLTSVVCKLMESAIRDNMLDHLITNNLLTDKQFGFVPGRSCGLQLLLCLEKWTKSLDAGNEVDVIYTDFSKAFHRVSLNKLMQKLHALGIQGKMLNWIRNFLSGRLQMVRVNDSCSDWVSVTSGVPQGSVLGPVLFLIYINDLPDVVESHMIELFADDAKLAKDIVSEEDAEGLQQSIYKVLEWSKANGLKLNSSKCKCYTYIETRHRKDMCICWTIKWNYTRWNLKKDLIHMYIVTHVHSIDFNMAPSTTHLISSTIYFENIFMNDRWKRVLIHYIILELGSISIIHFKSITVILFELT